MPKLKTNKGAAKRFRFTGSGKIKRCCAFFNHNLSKKSSQRKRDLRHGALVHESDEKEIRSLLPYRKG